MARGQQNLVALAGEGTPMPWLYAFSLAMLIGAASGAPILGPDLDSCVPKIIPSFQTAADAVNCCFVDTSRPIVDFKFNSDLPMRVRRPVHKLTQIEISRYERGYELMRALPPDDPRSFVAQAKLHCAYTCEVYSQFNSSAVMEVHKSWFFFPFHRWYTYFHERILASLLGDDTFTIPYWAWDVQNETSPPANIIPYIFMNESSSLYDSYRNQQHAPPARVNLDMGMPDDGDGHNRQEGEELKRSNYFQMWSSMIGDTKTPEAFYGGKIALGDPRTDLEALPEHSIHTAVHVWTATGFESARRDMANSAAAALDPIFHAHHSNFDRLWTVWKSFGGQDLDDPDWLNTEFLFYDENADLVRVNIRDSLNLAKLSLSYNEETRMDWMDYTPLSIRKTGPKSSRVGRVGSLWRQVIHGEIGNMAAIVGSLFRLKAEEGVAVALGGRTAVTKRVSRPTASFKRMIRKRSGNTSSPLDEVLVISGVVTKPIGVQILVHIFLELPEADEHTARDCAESLGSIFSDGEGKQGVETVVTREFSKRIGISDRLRILDVDRLTSLTVTFVPAWHRRHDSHVSVDFTVLRTELRILTRPFSQT